MISFNKRRKRQTIKDSPRWPEISISFEILEGVSSKIKKEMNQIKNDLDK